jgi:hypothetical protein
LLTQCRPPANKPKPNTRFLRNIIKDTDSHNAALLAKEAADSQARLKNLGSNAHREKRSSRVGGGDIRKRQLGDIAAILGGRSSKRKRTEASRRDKDGRRVNTSSEDEEPERQIDQGRRREHQNKDYDEEDRRFRSRRIDDKDGANSEKSRDRKSHRRRHRSRSEDRDGDDRERRRRSTSDDRTKDKERRRRHRSRTPKELRIKEPRCRSKSPKRKFSESPQRERSHRSRKEFDKEAKPDYDSDPLDDIIGPRPPPVPEVRSRGRGAMSLGSGIDSRFSATYDPTVDVQLDPEEENDWDQALEALRDRQKWKQQGADRLRAAGFTDEEIRKWEKGGEKREEDVKWAKKGEGREWDRGKVVGADGVITTGASWGRLGGAASDGDDILAESTWGRLKGT